MKNHKIDELYGFWPYVTESFGRPTNKSIEENSNEAFNSLYRSIVNKCFKDEYIHMAKF